MTLNTLEAKGADAPSYTPEQLELIKNTVAKGATNDEFKLFLYRAQRLGLDPLRTGEIYFIKYGNNPGSIVIGLDGFRLRASRTNKHVGTKRGVLRDESGKCIGAWAEVYRLDWKQPAHEEVSLAEYSTGRANWLKMPETMIKKVAEVAALRMAFPDELGGLYSKEEMEQAAPAVEPITKPRPALAGAVRDLNHSLPTVAKQYDLISPSQRKQIFELSSLVGITNADLQKHITHTYNVGTTHALTILQYNKLMAYLNMELDKKISDERVDVDRVVKVGTDDDQRISPEDDCGSAPERVERHSESRGLSTGSTTASSR